MKRLREKIENDKLTALQRIAPVNRTSVRRSFSVDPDYDFNTYEGFTEKEYFIRDAADLKDEFKYVFDVELEDYGYDFDGELLKEKNNEGTGRLSLQLNRRSLRSLAIELEGSIFGSGADFGGMHDDPVAELVVIGVDSQQRLELFEELLLEAYSLELEVNHRVSFFTYFTAIEAFATALLKPVQDSIPAELHDALERLQLDDKLRIVAKEAFNTVDLASIKIWGDFCGLFRSLKEKRNQIAHGQGIVSVNQSDVDDVFLMACTLICFAKHKLGSYDDVRKFLYPKQAR
ncbi:hypothetical protein [Cupriavidus sp. PET2-C1]